MPTLCHRIGARSEKISRFFESSRSTDSRCCVPSESGGELDNDDGDDVQNENVQANCGRPADRQLPRYW